MTDEIVLRKIELRDLPQVARVHKSSFPESALTKLGLQIIEQYYEWQLTGPHPKVWAIAAFDGETCAGFSFSGLFKDSTSGFVYTNKTFLIKEVLRHPWLLSNPLFLDRLRIGITLLRKWNKRQVKTLPIAPDSALHSFGILSLAVSNEYQNFGIGKLLLLDAEREAVRCGFRQMDLTVHPSNTKAIKFYERLGWQKTFQGDAWKGVMVKLLKACAASEIIVNEARATMEIVKDLLIL